MNSLKKAIIIATQAHKGPVDKAGKDYIQHPLFVSTLCKNKKEKIVAVLHDVVEDTNITLKYLSQYFTKDIIEAIRCISKEKNYKLDEYLYRVKNNKLARIIKISDLTHNMELSRLTHVTKEDILRVEKYKKCLKYLKDIS